MAKVPEGKRRRRPGDAGTPLTDAQRRLVEEGARLAFWLAGARARRHGVPAAEHLDGAVDGLIRAARDFDPARGIPFSSFASALIRWSMANAAGKGGDAPDTFPFSSFPPWVVETLTADPTDPTDPTGPGPDGEGRAVVPFERLIGLVPGPGEARPGLAAAVYRNRDSEVDREILRLRFLDGMTYAEAGRATGLHRTSVRRRERRAMAEIRAALA